MPKRTLALSAKVLVCDAAGRCLLLKRSGSSSNNPGKWDLPGGKVDAGERFEDGLLREVVEETGLTVSLGRALGAAESDLPARRVIYLIMEARAVSGQVRLSEEHEEFAWVERLRVGSLDVCEQFRAFLERHARSAEG